MPKRKKKKTPEHLLRRRGPDPAKILRLLRNEPSALDRALWGQEWTACKTLKDIAERANCSVYQLKKQMTAMDQGRLGDPTYWRGLGRPRKDENIPAACTDWLTDR